MKEMSMQAYQGFFSPGLCFANGHAMRIYNFTSTPAGIAPFFQIWMLMPSGERILYIDPQAASAVVSQWYNFDRIVGARIDWQWLDSGTLQVRVEASDGQILELHLHTGSSWATALLNAVVKITPRGLMRTRPMLAVSGLSFNLLLGLGGVEIAGSTDTGRAYVTEADRVTIVTDASARLDHLDLGDLTRPSKPLRFGKSRIADRAVLAFGTASIEGA